MDIYFRHKIQIKKTLIVNLISQFWVIFHNSDFFLKHVSY